MQTLFWTILAIPAAIELHLYKLISMGNGLSLSLGFLDLILKELGPELSLLDLTVFRTFLTIFWLSNWKFVHELIHQWVTVKFLTHFWKSYKPWVQLIGFDSFPWTICLSLQLLNWKFVLLTYINGLQIKCE